MAAVLEYFPFDNQPSYEAQWRDMGQHFISTGVIVQGTELDEFGGNCAVEAGTGLQVEVQTGKAWIKGHMFKHTGDPVALAINSNTSGSTRTDLVVLRVDFVSNTISYVVLSGTTIPVQNANIWDLPLANVTILNNATDAASFTITDRRLFACDPSLVPSVRVYSNASQTMSSGAWTSLNLNAGSFWITDSKLYPGTDATKIIIPQDGFYTFQGRVTVSGSTADNANDRRGIRIWLNGTQAITVMLFPNRTQALELSTMGFWRCVQGDYIQLQAYQSTQSGATATCSLAELGARYDSPITG
jgi:hypothetical protein